MVIGETLPAPAGKTMSDNISVLEANLDDLNPQVFGYVMDRLLDEGALDVFGVHGVGGAVGAFLTGVLAVAWVGGEGKGGLIDGNPHQVITQLYGIAVVVVYDAIASLILLKLVDLTIGLRVDAEMEREGLDLAIHGEAVQ